MASTGGAGGSGGTGADLVGSSDLPALSLSGDVAPSADAPVAPDSPRRPPFYIADDEEYSCDLFTVPAHYRPYVHSIMITRGMITDRIDRLAHDIREDYGEEAPHLLCVLKGAHAFFSDLGAALNRHHEYSPHERAPYTFDFVRVKSYVDDHSTGEVQIIGMSDFSAFKGKHLIVVEDIIDSGLTMSRLLPKLRTYGPKSVRVASLLQKRTPRATGFLGHYVGFSIPDKFIVGYNLDFNESFRTLRHLCVINERGKAYFSTDQKRRDTLEDGSEPLPPDPGSPLRGRAPKKA